MCTPWSAQYGCMRTLAFLSPAVRSDPTNDSGACGTPFPLSEGFAPEARCQVSAAFSLLPNSPPQLGSLSENHRFLLTVCVPGAALLVSAGLDPAPGTPAGTWLVSAPPGGLHYPQQATQTCARGSDQGPKEEQTCICRHQMLRPIGKAGQGDQARVRGGRDDQRARLQGV